MASPVDVAKAAGYTDEEINAYLAPRVAKALESGYSQEEINAHLGITPPPAFDPNKVRSIGEKNFSSSAKPVTSFADALSAGWQMSVTGLQLSGQVPNKVLAYDAPMASRIGAGVAQMAGDIPAMIGGAVVGGAAAAATGPGAVIGGAAGAFALPTALRELMVDAYSKGSIQTFPDFWERIAPVMLDTAKSWVTGAATGGAGAVVAPLSVGLPPVVAGAAKTAAEVATMTTVGKALEGEVPSARDFVDGAILLGGLKFAGAGAGKLRELYAKSGISPSMVLDDAKTDVTITQDLLSSNKDIPARYEDQVARPEPSRAEQILTELDEKKAPDEEYRSAFSTGSKDALRPGETWREKLVRWVESEKEPLAEELASGEPPAEPPKEPPGGEPPAEPPKEPPGGEPPADAPKDAAEAQRRILEHISVGERESTRRFTLDRLYTYVFDRLFPISRATSEAAKALGEALPDAADNPYVLSRLYAGVAGKAQQMLNSGTFDFNTAETNGPGLRAVLKPMESDLDGFRAFLAARRALELNGRGIETGFDLDAARMVVEAGGKYAETASALTDYQNRVAAYLRDSGVLSREGYDAMLAANKTYVPFQRLMEDSGITKRVPGGTLSPSNPIHKIEGSERVVLDPLETVIRNTYLFSQMAERNAVGTALVDLLGRANETVSRKSIVEGAEETAAALREHGVGEGAEELAQVMRGGETAAPDEIRVFRDGKPETFEVDPELAAAFKGLERESANLLIRVVGAPARLLRAGATLTPDFMARNLIRDFFSAVINTGGAVFSPLDTARGLASVLREDNYYQDWLKGGGANSALVSLDRRYLQENIETLTKETGLGTRAWNVVRHPIELLRYLSETSEQATRVGEFRKVYTTAIAAGKDEKAAIQEAAYSSREVTLDFARMGAKLQAMNMLTAFFNAQLQGGDRMARAFHDKPVSTSLKVAGAITLPSILLWLNNHDDERVKELPAWQKDLFWIIPTDKWEDAAPHDIVEVPSYLLRTHDGKVQINNGALWRLPKPFEAGVLFGSGPERILDSLFTDRPEPFKGFAGSVLSALLPGMIPTVALPVIEQYANRSTFTDRTLIPANMEKHLPEYQYTQYTTETAKALGKLLGAFPGVRDASIDPGTPGGGVARAITSPILLENYLRAWTGNLGTYALQLTDAALRKAGLLPDPVGPASTLADIPFVRAFIARYPSASAQSIQDFQDNYTKNKIVFDTWQALAKEGDAEAMQRVLDIGGAQMLVRLDDIHKSLTTMQQAIRNIYKDPATPPEQKRQLIDTAYWRMIELSRTGAAVMRPYEGR